MKPSQKIKQNVVNQIAKTTLYENVSELMKIESIKTRFFLAIQII